MGKKKPMTHSVNIRKIIDFGKTSIRIISVRETNLYWIDEYGSKYNKISGTEIGERYAANKCDLSTLALL